MGLFSSLGNVVGSVVGGLSSGLSSGLGDWTVAVPFLGDKTKFDYQREVDAKNFELQERNLANQDRAFNEQAFMNRNGLTIQAAQAQKMGMNPLSMSGGSVGSVSASPVSPVSSSAGSNGSSASGIIGTLISSLISAKTQKDIAKIQKESAKDVADTSADATVKAAETNANANTYGADKKLEGDKYSADSQRAGAWERLIEEQESIDKRNKDSIESAEKIAKDKVNSEKMNQVLDILKYNREAQRDYIKDKAKVLSDMYEYFRARGDGISQKGFDDWFSSAAYNASVYAKNFFKALTPSALKRMNRDEFTDWFQKNFEFAPFKPINIDEYINSYKDLK